MTASPAPDAVTVGADGCHAGWFYFAHAADGATAFGVAPDFASLLEGLGDGARVLVDIPIGLLEDGVQERACDRMARRLLSPGRGSSVFPTPCRQAVYAADYAAASATNRQVLGRGLSRQSWNIAAKIRDVDEALRAGSAGVQVREGHPELAFRGLAAAPLAENKKTRAGNRERVALLERHLPGARRLIADAFLEHGGFDCARDDIVDALVLMVIGLRWSECVPVPAEPPVDPRGLPMAIYYLPLDIPPTE